MLTTGYFSGTVNFDPGPGAYDLTSQGSSDAFVWELDSQGNFVWARQFAGTSGGSGGLITTDASGNIYVSGTFSGTVNFDPVGGTYDLTSAGGLDGFVLKLDRKGGFVWARRLGGSGDDETLGIVVDSSGNVYTTGFFSGTVNFATGSGTFDLTSAGSGPNQGLSGPVGDAFLWELDSGGNFVWAGRMGGPLGDTGTGLAIDGSQNVFMTGSFSDTANFAPGPGTFNLTRAGYTDYFLAKYSFAHNVTVRVDDGRGGFDTQSYTIDVSSAAPGEIQGTVFNDLNGNGTRDSNEPGLQDWTIYLDQNHERPARSRRAAPRRPTRMATTPSRTWPPGTYTVAEVAQAGWNQTAPPRNLPGHGQRRTGRHRHRLRQPAVDHAAGQPSALLHSTAPTTATVGQLFRYDAKATDPDNDPLTYDLVVKPDGMGVDPTTGTVVWTPTASQLGPQNVTLRVQDGRGGVDLQSFTIIVSQADTPPVITSQPKGPAVVGRSLDSTRSRPRTPRTTRSPSASVPSRRHDDRPEDGARHLDPDRRLRWAASTVEITASDNQGALDHADLRPARRGHRDQRPADDHLDPPAGRSGWGRPTSTRSSPPTPTATP